MSQRYSWAAAAIIAAGLSCAACGRPSAAAESTAPAAEAAKPAGPKPVVVDPTTRSTIKTLALANHDQSSTLTIAGKVQFDEDRVARVLAPLPGQIVDLHVKVGDAVRKGQPLCVIGSRDVSAAVGDHLQSHKDLDLAEKTLTMTQDLFDHQAASKIALQQAESDVAKARSRVAQNEESLRVLGLSDIENATATGRVVLPSPLSGTVIERKVTEGQFVQTDSTPIITIADLSTVWVIGDIFERDLHLVALGRPATISVTAYPGEQFLGRIDYISDVIDPVTRTAKVRIAVPNPHARLKVEMFATISLGVGEPETVLTVPSSAAFIDAGQTWVYIAAGKNAFVRKAATLGPDDNGQRRVLGGVKAGDEVVIDGGLLLRQEEELGASS
ncbi:MAG TPA: efflux RND transporter periplasmic adaptor subunit [Vicinamibacterales bacterium]|jgi:cobalt-zinc-cadmium efflux system membrane fusion protein|nr:efflux RND transporter periplasmic adaptor subunit [Vicinamibacterales bacterium]